MRKLFLLIFVSTSMMINVHADTISVSFNTLGNCTICKDRIEGAARPLPGVISVTWKIIGDVTSLVYNSDSTDVYRVMHAIAGVGHDTEWFAAPDSAYNTLVGTCCEYERTNNYQQVQVGFLALMGNWYYPLGQAEINMGRSLKVFPNPAGEVISFSLDGFNGRYCNAALYSLSGNMVSATSFSGNGNFDLKNMSPGEYILVIDSDGILIDRKKVIKR